MAKFYITFLVIILSFSFVTATYAEDVNDSIIGILEVTKDGNGNITSISLATESYDDNDNLQQLSYKIPVTEQTSEMATKYDGKEVQVVGKMDSEKQEFEVSSYELISDNAPVDEAVADTDDEPETTDGEEVKDDQETPNVTEEDSEVDANLED